MSKFMTVRERGPELLDNFADNEWSAIIWACQTGNVPETWTVGSQKAMTINGKDYGIDIIGLYHDDYADGSGKAPITFQMHDEYETMYAPHSSNTTVGGWGSCTMRTTTLPAIMATMPTEVQAAIREVNKKTAGASGSSTIQTTADKLFLLSEYEVFGARTQSHAQEGEQYKYYPAGTGGNKIKNFNGSPYAWCERSPVGTAAYAVVGIYGTADVWQARDASGVAFAFCF